MSRLPLASESMEGNGGSGGALRVADHSERSIARLPKPDPDCSWCDAVNTLEHVWTELGSDYYICSCCAKHTRVDERGVAQRVKPRPEFDVPGNYGDH